MDTALLRLQRNANHVFSSPKTGISTPLSPQFSVIVSRGSNINIMHSFLRPARAWAWWGARTAWSGSRSRTPWSPGRTSPAVQYSTVQYSTVQYSTVQYSIVQYSTVQCGDTCLHLDKVIHSTAQYSTVQYITLHYSTLHYITVQYSTVLCGDTCLHLDKVKILLILLPTTNVNILLTGDFFKVDFRFIETCSMINRYRVKCHLCFESRLKSNIRFVTAIILSGWAEPRSRIVMILGMAPSHISELAAA